MGINNIQTHSQKKGLLPMRETSVNQLIRTIFRYILLVGLISGFTFADNNLVSNTTLSDYESDEISILLSLLQKIGFDFSYGNDGETIFSMVDKSLTQIISSLASGNVEGFMDIPIIKETLAFANMTVEDVVIDPDV